MSDDLIKRLRVVTGFIRFETEDRIAASACLSEEAAARIEELEAKLAKAVEAIFEAIYLLDPDEEDIAKGTGIYRIVTTFKELKGQDDE